MAKIDREAWFRGKIADHAVSKSKNGFPQWAASLVATEIWDTDEKKWVDFSAYSENEAVTYQTLFGGDGSATLAVAQIKKITGWSGTSFKELNEMDLSECGIQWHMAWDTYEGKDRLIVAWIQEYDAEPGTGIRKINEDELAALDSAYRTKLQAGGKPVTPAKPSTKKPSKPKPAPVNLPPKVGPQELPTDEQDQSKPDLPASEDKAQPGTVTQKGKTQKPSKPVTKKPTKPTIPGGEDTCTKAEAWDAICEASEATRASGQVTDSDLAKHYQDGVKKFGGGKPVEQLSEAEWAKVRDYVIPKVSKF